LTKTNKNFVTHRLQNFIANNTKFVCLIRRKYRNVLHQLCCG